MQREITPRTYNLDDTEKLPDDFDSSILENQHETKWAKFCAMPDVVPPVRMPSLFPVPTHIIKRRITKTLSFTGQTNAYIVWSPEFFNSYGQLHISHDSTDDNIDPADTSVVFTPGDWVLGNSSRFFDITRNITDEIGHGGVRLIGACLKLIYIGKVDDQSGLIEVGMHLNSHSLSLNTATGFSHDVHMASLDEITQQSYYTQHHAGSGVKLIWVPVDPSKFELKKCVQVDNTTGLPVLGTTIGGASDATSQGMYFDLEPNFFTTTDFQSFLFSLSYPYSPEPLPVVFENEFFAEYFETDYTQYSTLAEVFEWNYPYGYWLDNIVFNNLNIQDEFVIGYIVHIPFPSDRSEGYSFMYIGTVGGLHSYINTRSGSRTRVGIYNRYSNGYWLLRGTWDGQISFVDTLNFNGI